MINKQNLVPNSARTPEERRRNATKAGKASGVARRAKRNARELVKLMLDCAAPDKLREQVKRLFPFMEEADVDFRSVLLSKKVQNAMNGRSADINELLDLAGEGPDKRQTIDVTSSDGSMSPAAADEKVALRFEETLRQIHTERAKQGDTAAV